MFGKRVEEPRVIYDSDEDDDDGPNIIPASVGRPAAATSTSASVAGAVFDSNGQMLTSSQYQEALKKVIGSTMFFVKNGQEYFKRYYFIDPQFLENKSMSHGVFQVDLKDCASPNAACAIGNVLKRKEPETVNAIKKHMSDISVKDKIIVKESESCCIYGLWITSVISSCPQAPIGIRIAGIDSENITIPWMYNNQTDSYMAILMHQMPETAIISKKKGEMTLETAFLGVEVDEKKNVAQTQDGEDVDYAKWGDLMGSYVGVNMDSSRYFWLGMKLGELIAEYHSENDKKLPPEITQERYEAIVKLNTERSKKGYTYDVMNDKTNDYIGEMARTVNPQVTALTASATKQVGWSFFHIKDAYVVPKEFIKWADKKYKERIKTIKSVPSKSMVMKYSMLNPKAKFDASDSCVFGIEVHYFNPTMIIYTDLVTSMKK